MLFNKSLKSLIVLSIVLGSCAILSAWSVTDTYFGNKFNNLDARAFAMGGAGTYNDMRPFAFSSNPANLTLLKKNLGFQVNTSYLRNEDNRSLPLYNSFDSYIDDAVYSTNVNKYDDFAASILGSYTIGAARFGLGAYHKPLLSFDANYDEQIRNNRNTDSDTYPEMIARNGIANTGLLNQTGFVYSMALYMDDVREINIGVDYSLINGDIEQLKTIKWTDWARTTVATTDPNFVLPDYAETMKTTMEGSQIKFGTSIKMNSRLGIAASISPKTILVNKGMFAIDKSEYSTSATNMVDASHVETAINEDYILPTEFRGGICYQPRNIMRTWLNMDLEYVQWSDVNEAFDDVWNLYVGVEHQVDNHLPLRFGFQSLQSWQFATEQVVVNGVSTDVYIANKIITPMITAGSSIKVMKNVTLDLGFGYAWREYEALDMFGDTYYNDKLYTGRTSYLLWPNQYIALADRGWENPDKVRESFMTLTTGLSFTW
ncbi:MAG: hypothetical protein CVU48_03170 [Candidatus Cloacimonetes bacterium HGW-Cloacimonetes-1]|jgi:hypothetical protein|nr:MAG: hypothetical protein CVU48_03170 [Candidatus Cloacimonetes bacterium HGW-Cloacimonetes-1]